MGTEMSVIDVEMTETIRMDGFMTQSGCETNFASSSPGTTLHCYTTITLILCDRMHEIDN